LSSLLSKEAFRGPTPRRNSILVSKKEDKGKCQRL
jgi:hypothetical protein